MLKCWLCLPLLAGLALGYLVLVQTTGNAGQDQDRIGDLVKQLGSAKYAEREKAKKELETIGLPALEQLKKASKDGDLETRQRCLELVKKLEDKVAADTLLAPKKVKLSFKDTPVMQAIEELQRQSGYQIIVEGDRVPLAKRTITLETGEITFWEAFDKICQAGNLTEVPTGYGLAPNVYYELDNVIQIMPVKQLPPVQIQPVPPQPAPAPAVKGAANKPAVDPPPPPLPPVKGAGNGGGQVFELQVQLEMPAAAGKGQAVVAKVAVPVQIGEAGQAGQPGQAGQSGQAGAVAPAIKQPGVAQIQRVQGGQAQPLPAVQPRKTPNGTPSRVYQPGTVVVRDGANVPVPTFYHGALRIRLLPASKATEVSVQPAKKGEVVYIIEVTAEPRLQQFSVVGTPRLDMAMDDQGQELVMAKEPVAEPTGNHAGPTAVIGRNTTYVPYSYPQPRQVAIRLILGQKQATHLKELKGVVSVQALSPAPEALITVDDVIKSTGKTVRGVSGGLIEVTKIEKLKNGNYSVKFRYEQPPQFFPANNPVAAPPAGGGAKGGGGGKGGLAAQAVQIQPAKATIASGISSSNQGLPVLVDANGKVFPMQQMQQSRSVNNNGVIVSELTCVYRVADGAGEPTQFVLFGHRMVTAQVPFRFENVNLEQK